MKHEKIDVNETEALLSESMSRIARAIDVIEAQSSPPAELLQKLKALGEQNLTMAAAIREIRTQLAETEGSTLSVAQRLKYGSTLQNTNTWCRNTLVTLQFS